MNRREFLKQLQQVGQLGMASSALSLLPFKAKATSMFYSQNDPMGIWVPTTTSGAPPARYNSAFCWTGSQLYMMGGYNGTTESNTSYLYDPATDSWGTTSTGLSVREQGTAIMVGPYLVVWGGMNGSTYYNDGVYSTDLSSFSSTSTTGACPVVRSAHSVVSTGSTMIVWGGTTTGGTCVNTGGIYNPSSNTWTATSSSGVPTARQNHSAVWTGTDMIIWGGINVTVTNNTGARLNSGNTAWTATSTTSAPSQRHSHSTVWTGSKMIIWGGYSSSSATSALADGGIYDPSNDTWTALPTTGAPSARGQHSAVWTGSEMIVFGGRSSSTYYNDGAIYNPVSNSWRSLNYIGAANVPATRIQFVYAWTGNDMVIICGNNSGTALNTGARYRPKY